MTYHSRTKPWQHQQEYPRRLAKRPSVPGVEDVFSLTWEMGCGKSKPIVDEFGSRVDARDLDRMLLIAPAGSYRNWLFDKTEEQQSELRTHMDPHLFARLSLAAWISGGRKSDAERIERMMRSDRPKFLACNVEALSTVERAKLLCRQFLEEGIQESVGFGGRGRRARSMVVVDESTRIRGDSNRTDTVHSLAELTEVRRIMTGLITPRDPMDLFRQYWFLDWRILGQRNFYAFRARYAIMQKMMMRGRTVSVVVGFRNQEELRERIAPWTYRVLLEDCIDMPGETFQTRDVGLSAGQRRMIRELLEQATTRVEGTEVHATKTIKLATLTAIDQILLGWLEDEEGQVHEVQTHCYDALLETLEEHSGKAIIWTPFQQSLKKAAALLEEAYGPGSVALFYGGNRAVRHEDEKRFLSDPKCRFMISTPAAGGVGNTWNVATLRVYLGNSHDLEHRLQSEKRNYRGGQTQHVTSVDLTWPEVPVTTKKLVGLRKKLDIASVIQGDPLREWLL